jgi:mRNA-degrading endonuclease toxin of MazEF toxin-antitoxin module
MIAPGQIYMADFGPAGPHPIIVVSREELNRGRYALAVVCTSARFAVRSKLSNCVPFQAGNFGFTADCVAQCENILSIDQAQIALATGPIGTLDEATFHKGVRSIGYVIKSDCKPL